MSVDDSELIADLATDLAAIWERLRARLLPEARLACAAPQRMPGKMWSTKMNQEFPYPAKLFADAAKSFQELSGQNLNSMGGYVPPIAQTMVKFNIEMMRLAAKRAVECSELPEKLAKCQSTPEMFKVQMNFLETMRQQYTEEWLRLMEITNEMSWSAIKPDGAAAAAETTPSWPGMAAGWGGMTPWAPWGRRESETGAQTSPATPKSRAAA